VFIKGTSLSECAATAAYVGGRDSHLELMECDVIGNGHSGIFVDGSNATILDSNISDNQLTGISVVNGGTAILDKNDIFGNHSTPLEYNLSDDDDEEGDREEAREFRSQVETNNKIGRVGTGKLRSLSKIMEAQRREVDGFQPGDDNQHGNDGDW
jgi:parallel beta-helix repeat protein